MSTSKTENDEQLVTVVLPTYGRDVEFFREAVDSVHEQTYQNIELIVVDDATEPLEPPETRRLADVRCIRGSHDGAAAARNTGTEAANGEFIAFLDDDDRWYPEKIEQQLRRFRGGDASVGVVLTGQRYVDERGKTIGIYEPELQGDTTLRLLFAQLNCAFSTLMVRSSALDRAGRIDERFQTWEDWEWCVRLSRSCEFSVVPDPLVTRREGEYEQLTDDFENMRDRSYPLFLRKHRSLAAEYGAMVERRMVAELSLVLGAEGLDNGYYSDARVYLLKSIASYPFSVRFYLYFALALGGRFSYQPLKRLRELMHSRSHDNSP